MWGYDYEPPTALEDFERRLDSRINKIEDLLDRVESCIYDAQWETIEHISSVKDELNKPFTKWEWITLFIWGIWWNILVSWFIPDSKLTLIYIWWGIIICMLLIWLYLFYAKSINK